MEKKLFGPMEIDALGEMMNISLGSSATAVSTMLNARVDITTPIVNVVSKEEFKMDKVEPAVGVEITYVAGLEGENVMLLKRHDVKVIVEMLMGMEMPDEEFELNEINISAVCEVMNQMMGAAATSMSVMLERKTDISIPDTKFMEDGEYLAYEFPDDDKFVKVGFKMKIGKIIDSPVVQLYPHDLGKAISDLFLIKKAKEKEKQ